MSKQFIELEAVLDNNALEKNLFNVSAITLIYPFRYEEKDIVKVCFGLPKKLKKYIDFDGLLVNETYESLKERLSSVLLQE